MLKFLYSIILILLVAGLVWFSLSFFGENSDGPGLSFVGPETVPAGAPFDLEVGISNNSDQVFQDARISLSLPEGVIFLGQSSEKTLAARKIGNLGIGSLISETFNLMVIPSADDGQLEEKTIAASVDYSPEFLGSRFKKEEKWHLQVEGSAVELKVSAPDKVTSGRELEIKITYQNTSGIDLDNLILTAEYPSGFTYNQATLKPDADDNQWQLGGLRKGSAGSFSIIGKLIGPESNFFNFGFKMEGEFSGKSYVLNRKETNVAIKIAPLDLEILTKGVSDYVAGLADTINYTISYNYLQSVGRKALIKAKLSGQMFDLDSLKIGPPNGQWRPGDNTIIWNLENLSQSGSVNFTIMTKDTYPIKRLGDRNFVLMIEAQMEDENYVTVAQTENKVVGKVVVDAQAFFRDAASGIINKGPFPPQVGQPTQYTVHWSLVNYATDLRDVVVKAGLPAGVKFAGGENVVYNADRNEIIWQVNQLSATRGVISKPLEIVFQIEAVPQTGNAGGYLFLLDKTVVTATDEFTGFPLSHEDDALTTRLPDDPTVGFEGIVR